jgi:hypothetical protein
MLTSVKMTENQIISDDIEEEIVDEKTQTMSVDKF